MVAFHFQFANQAAWECDSCRKSGLARKRRCGWLPEQQRAPLGVVWARRTVTSSQCPKSVVTAASLAWLERFHAWKACGGDLLERPAKEAEAILLLESELRKEYAYAERRDS